MSLNTSCCPPHRSETTQGNGLTDSVLPVRFSIFVRELKQAFVSSIEGSAQKKQVALYCRRLGIDYTKLTEV